LKIDNWKLKSKKKMNMKKEYIEPSIKMQVTVYESLLASASELDPTKDDQNVTPTEEEYDGEFGAKKFHSVWEE
jgi:hypothetical protein